MMKQNIIAQPTNQPAQFSLVIAELIFSVVEDFINIFR